MEDLMEDKYKIWYNEAEKFEGDKALFWAGKMATMIDILRTCSISVFSGNFELLSFCQIQYNNAIYSRTKS